MTGPEYTMFYTGAILPDLVSKPPTIVFPGQDVYWFVQPTHAPIAVALMGFALVMFLEERLRGRFLMLLGLGIASHYLLDLMQKHLLGGAYYWLFPFSWITFNIPVFWPSDTVLAIPFLLLAVGVMEVLSARRRHAPVAPRAIDPEGS